MEVLTAATLNQNREPANQAFGARGAMRAPVGGRLLRQLILRNSGLAYSTLARPVGDTWVSAGALPCR